jgi:apolipoprotein D and lipocalin family protein
LRSTSSIAEPATRRRAVIAVSYAVGKNAIPLPPLSDRMDIVSRSKCFVAMPALLKLSVAAAALGLAESATALTPVPEFELSRYMGSWYEIASIPGAFRGKCARDTRAEYSPDEGGALVLRTRCISADGNAAQSEGRGRPLEPALPSVLKVTFVNQFGIWWYPFGRNQVVIASGRDYEWMVIGDPSLSYGRILARQPSLSSEALRAAVAVLTAEKYDLCAFTFKPQTGGRTQTSRLCDEKP